MCFINVDCIEIMIRVSWDAYSTRIFSINLAAVVSSHLAAVRNVVVLLNDDTAA